jgi:hypothetical protein
VAVTTVVPALRSAVSSFIEFTVGSTTEAGTIIQTERGIFTLFAKPSGRRLFHGGDATMGSLTVLCSDDHPHTTPGNATPKKHAASSLRLQDPGKQDGSDSPVRNYSARAAAR